MFAGEIGGHHFNPHTSFSKPLKAEQKNGGSVQPQETFKPGSENQSDPGIGLGKSLWTFPKQDGASTTVNIPVEVPTERPVEVPNTLHTKYPIFDLPKDNPPPLIVGDFNIAGDYLSKGETPIIENPHVSEGPILGGFNWSGQYAKDSSGAEKPLHHKVMIVDDMIMPEWNLPSGSPANASTAAIWNSSDLRIEPITNPDGFNFSQNKATGNTGQLDDVVSHEKWTPKYWGTEEFLTRPLPQSGAFHESFADSAALLDAIGRDKKTLPIDLSPEILGSSNIDPRGKEFGQ